MFLKIRNNDIKQLTKLISNIFFICLWLDLIQNLSQNATKLQKKRNRILISIESKLN